MRVASAAVVLAALGLFAGSRLGEAEGVVSPSRRTHVRALESELARRPNEPRALASLARAHLDDGNSGLAVSTIEGASRALRDDAEVTHVLSGAMLLRHAGQGRAAGRVERAVDRLLAEGKVLTRDLGGRATTSALTDRLVALLHQTG